MADEAIGPRAFIILEDTNIARHDTLNACIELVKREQAKNPTRKFIVAQVLASIEPVVTTKVIRHF